MNEIRFNREFAFRYGVVERLSPLVRRVVAPNPGPFTFHGTATFIVGNREVAVIDPGPDLPAHIAAIADGLGDETIRCIIATHTHADHSPGCGPLQRRCGAPIHAFGAHPNAASASADRDFAPDRCLRDGDVLAGLDWHLRAVHTPGHCANHLCLALPEESTLFCGDQLMAWAPTAIAPPDGDVADYIASLEALRRRPERLYRPTHGAAISNPREYIEQMIAHRRRRIEQVRDAVAAGVADIPAMRARIYADVDADLRAAAERSILGSLHFLIRQGRIVADGVVDGVAGLDAVFRCVD
ncbi:MAG: MBL fold metallo-hydrolase [bacterium]